MMDDWRDSVGTFLRLQTAVWIIAQGAKRNKEGRNAFAVMMDRATFALVGLLPDHFPTRLRGRATKVLSARSRVRQDYVGDALFHFERLKPKDRKALISDLLSLYEACLLDLGRMVEYREIIYP
jgi:hypothetical protein